MLAHASGSLLSSRYRLDALLGRGGAGEVWRAHDERLGRDVAVKLVTEVAGSERLLREARAAAGVVHPCVVTVFDVGTQDEVPYLVMELVDGPDLRTVLRATGPLPEPSVALLGRDLAAGLAAIHAAGLVHRDVTPGNVLLTRDGIARLGDLGIARDTDDDTARLTATGTVVGTVDYLSPEQLEDGAVTAATDVYALGLLLHEAVTGRPAFGAGTLAERAGRRLTADAPQPSGIDPRLADVLARATRRDPSARPADATEVVSAFEPLVERTARDQLAARVARTLDGALAERAPTPATVDTGSRTARADDDRTMALPVQDHTAALPGLGAAAAAHTSTSRRDEDHTITMPGTQHPDATPPNEPVEVATSTSTGRPRWVWLAGGAAVLVVIAGAVLATGGPDGSPAVTPTPTADTAASAPAPDADASDGDGAVVDVAAVQAFDPLGSGGEYDELAPRAIDGDPGSAWTTEGYESAALGNLKAGVGLVLDLGEPTDVAAVELSTPLPGADVGVAVTADAPQEAPEELDGAVQDIGEQATITLDQPVTGRYVTVWFTSLGPDGGRFRAAVGDLDVVAAG